jgi:protein O-GlcNAc transferase
MKNRNQDISELFNQAKNYLDVGEYKQAIALLQECINKNLEESSYSFSLSLAYLLNGNQENTQNIWMEVAQNQTDQKLLLNFLESYLLKFIDSFQFELVKKIYSEIYWLDDTYQNPMVDEAINQKLNYLSLTAISLVQEKKYVEAESKLLKILELSNDPRTWFNLGMLYHEMGLINKAIECLKNSIKLDNTIGLSYYGLGLSLEKNNDISNAIDAYQQAIKLNEDLVDAYNNLGNLYKKSDIDENAILIFQDTLLRFPYHHGAYINLGNLYLEKHQYQEALNIYKSAANKEIIVPEIYDGWVQALNLLGYSEQAIQLLNEATLKFPEDLFINRKKLLYLPIIYNDKKEIVLYRENFAHGLEILKETIDLKSQEGIAKAYAIVNGQSKTGDTNYYLAYQGYSDLAIQKQYGLFLHSIMKATYPQWMREIKLTSRKNKQRIRIGYVSQRMQSLLSTLLVGWLKHHNSEQFEIYSYSIDEKLDSKHEQEFQFLSDYYYHFPNQLEQACQQIKNDQIDILVYFEIGIDPLISQLASLKLAPIQCVTWGHPMTTGFPTIDYFLSSDAMEPVNGQDHYSEKLILLPKLGFNISFPIYCEKIIKRDIYGFKEEDIIYLSCQHIAKYLPQYDYIFAEICHQIPNAKLVFVKRTGMESIMQKFKNRLQKEFDKYSLSIDHYTYFINGLDLPGYFNLLLNSDIFLDTIGWSGGFTSLDAIASDLPIVTLPSEIMRGRQSYGMLKIINVIETIAQNEHQYIDIAVRLGLDKKFRQKVVQKMKLNKNLLFNDLTCIKALEKFYLEVIQTRLDSTQSTIS